MIRLIFLRRALGCAALALVLAWAPAAHGQAFRVPDQPNVNQQVPVQTQVASLQSAVQPGFNPSYPPMPFWPGSYGGFYPGRAGGFLYGVAAVTNANAQYQATIQQARITQQQANQAAFDTRRRALDEWRYEQSLRPTQNDLLEKEQMEALRRARGVATNTEIWSGQAINSLLRNIQQMQSGGLRGPLVPLDEEMLRHINLTTGTTVAGPGLFRDGGKLQWPFALSKPQFAQERARINELAPQIVKEALSGGINDSTLSDLSAAVESLRNTVDDAVRELSPTQFIQASRYVNNLRSTVRAMQDPNVVNQFNGKYAARGDNVTQLVEMMTRQGLRFAPANPGDEPFYTALHQALISYDMGLTQLVSRYNPNPQQRQ
jgi:hypothetical protein